MRTLIYAAALGGAAALVLVPAAAGADPKHCPPGLAKQDRCGADFRDHQRGEYGHDGWFERDGIFFQDRDRIDDAYEAGYRDGQRDAWRAGQRLPRDVDIAVIRDYDRYGLNAPRDGYYYGQVDGQTLLIQTATRMIAEALQ